MKGSLADNSAMHTFVDGPADVAIATAAWHHGHLWLGGASSTNEAYVGYYVEATKTWTRSNLDKPMKNVRDLWSDDRGDLWAAIQSGSNLRIARPKRQFAHFDGTRWIENLSLFTTADTVTFAQGATDELWIAEVTPPIALQVPGEENLRRVHWRNQPAIGGLCHAQELLCNETAHTANGKPVNDGMKISAAVGGSYGDADYFIDSTMIGRAKFTGLLPAGVTATFSSENAAGMCPRPGTGQTAPIVVSPEPPANGTITVDSKDPQLRPNQRYFVKLSSSSSVPVPVDITLRCHRTD
jgi:hypothetical protein